MAKGPEIEVIPNENAPDVRQLGHLARKLILFAQRHGRLRVSDTPEGGMRKYFVSPVQEYQCPEITDGAPFGYLFHYSTGASIKQDQDRVWNMRIFDSMHALELGSQRGGSRSTYTFSWDEEGDVNISRRSTLAVPDKRYEEMIDVVDNMQFRDDDAIVPYLHMELEQVTAEDVALLSQDLSRKIARIDSGDMQYKEPRKNYLDYYAK